MQKMYKGLIVLWMGVLFLVVACASRQSLVTIGPAKGETVIAVKAGDFKFEPNNIKAYKGDILVFHVENVSGTEHNFTVKDPKGNTIQSVSLPSKKTVTVKINLSETGTYEFYCDKPFHAGFGMKGWIETIE